MSATLVFTRILTELDKAVTLLSIQRKYLPYIQHFEPLQNFVNLNKIPLHSSKSQWMQNIVNKTIPFAAFMPSLNVGWCLIFVHLWTNAEISSKNIETVFAEVWSEENTEQHLWIEKRPAVSGGCSSLALLNCSDERTSSWNIYSGFAPTDVACSTQSTIVPQIDGYKYMS